MCVCCFKLLWKLNSGLWRQLEYLWQSWRQGGHGGQYQAERGLDCAALTPAEVWTCRAGCLRPGRRETEEAVGRRPKKWADVVAGSSPPSAAPWFYWSRLGYPADSQKPTLVTREQPASVQSVTLYRAMVPSTGQYMTLQQSLETFIECHLGWHPNTIKYFESRICPKKITYLHFLQDRGPKVPFILLFQEGLLIIIYWWSLKTSEIVNNKFRNNDSFWNRFLY